MKVIKEPLYVKQEEASDMTSLEARLDSVDHAEDSVRGCMVVLGSELSRREEIKTCRVQ